MSRDSIKHTGQVGSVQNALNPLDWQIVFLSVYRETKSVVRAANIAGVSRPTVYKYLKIDADFAEKFEHARQDAVDSLEESAFERARDGVERRTPYFYQGKLIHEKVERHYSDSLAEFLLKHLRPEVYNPAQNINHSISYGDEIEAKRVLLTEAIQNCINMGMTYEGAEKYLIIRGVDQEHLELVNKSDIVFPDSVDLQECIEIEATLLPEEKVLPEEQNTINVEESRG